jgi:hypothetical protein
MSATVTFKLVFTDEADEQLTALENSPGERKRLKAVRKALGLLETNLRHPSLHTHKYGTLSGAHGEDVFTAYAENKTPAAFRIFWHYGPDEGTITVLAVTAHP